MNRIPIIVAILLTALCASNSIAAAKKHRHAASSTPRKHHAAAKMSEAQRRSIYYEDGPAEAEADKEAEAKYPATDTPSTLLNAKMTVRLEEKCHQKLERKYHLSDAQFSKIMSEGMEKRWPTPP